VLGLVANVLYHHEDERGYESEDYLRPKPTDERVNEHIHAPVIEGFEDNIKTRAPRLAIRYQFVRNRLYHVGLQTTLRKHEHFRTI